MLSDLLRAELATEGIRVAAPVSREGGAGPTGDAHVVIDGWTAALPVSMESRFSLKDGKLWLENEDLGVNATPIARPRFYDELSSDGIPMHKLARLHGAGVLATTVVQSCVRYSPDQRCRYCSIEESLATSGTTRVKTPAQLAEVARAAVELDGVRQMVMTTGTAASSDRGARYLARCAAAVSTAQPGLPIQLQCEPPSDLAVLSTLRRAGAASIGIHVESFDDAVRSRWLPGKAQVPIEEYWRAWEKAVEVFGWNRVSTYLLVGLGEDPEALVQGAARLIEMGVYPFVVPVRPGKNTLAAKDGLRPPSSQYLASVSLRVQHLLEAAGMDAAGQSAGCAACGACSTLGASELRAAVAVSVGSPKQKTTPASHPLALGIQRSLG